MFDGPKIFPSTTGKKFTATYFGHEVGTYDSPAEAAAALVQASEDLTAYFKAQRAHIPAEPRDGIWGS